MAQHGKKYKKTLESLDQSKIYSIREGLEKIKEFSYARFDESITANICLGIDAQKADQAVRGSIILPHIIGKQKRIIAFAKGDQATYALQAGADEVGSDDLVEKILGGWNDFDHAVATPDLMAMVGKTARILGPRGVLPNKKNGTVALDLTAVIRELKSGLTFFKNDKSSQVNFTFGKKSCTALQLEENLRAFIKTLASYKPATSKGTFLKKMSVSSSMGPGIRVAFEIL